MTAVPAIDQGTSVLPWPAAPGRVFHLPARSLARIDGTADVTITMGK